MALDDDVPDLGALEGIGQIDEEHLVEPSLAQSSREVVASTTSTRSLRFSVRAFSRAMTLWSMSLVSTTERAMSV